MLEPMTVHVEVWPVAADEIGLWLLSERLINAGMADCGGLAAFRGAVRLRWAGAGPVFLDV